MLGDNVFTLFYFILFFLLTEGVPAPWAGLIPLRAGRSWVTMFLTHFPSDHQSPPAQLVLTVQLLLSQHDPAAHRLHRDNHKFKQFWSYPAIVRMTGCQDQPWKQTLNRKLPLPTTGHEKRQRHHMTWVVATLIASYLCQWLEPGPVKARPYLAFTRAAHLFIWCSFKPWSGLQSSKRMRTLSNLQSSHHPLTHVGQGLSRVL